MLVAGLGNPGPEYAHNRHNVGFMVAARLREILRGAGEFRARHAGEIAKGTLGGQEVVVLRPLTFMNRSGRSVQRAAAFFQIPAESIVVVHDDMDLPWQTIRVKVGGGSGGHKGLDSITECLGTDGTVRVRVGIGRPVVGTGESWVLSDFDDGERQELADVIDRAVRAVETIVTRGADRAMNEVNARVPKTKVQ